MQPLRQRYGDWALVTGASAGIGEAYARRLASEGLNLALLARRRDRLEALANELRTTYRVDALVVVADLARESFLQDVIGQVDGRPIGILINNAGFGLGGPFAKDAGARHADMVRVNCVAPVLLTSHYLPGMLQRGRGAIIFLSSVAASSPLPLFSTYAATKAFNLYLGEALWDELRRHGVDVLAVCPGTTRTEFQSIAGTGTERVSQRQPEHVVSTTLRALGKRPSVVDGAGNRILAALMRHAPRRWVLSIGRRIMQRHTSS